MKLKKIIIMAIFSIIFSIGFMNAHFQNTHADSLPQVSIDEYENNIKGVNNVSLDEVMNKIQSKQTFILFIGFKECRYTRAFSRQSRSLIQNDHAKVDYLDWDTVNDLGFEINNLPANIAAFFNHDLHFGGWPTLVLIKNGVVDQHQNYCGYGDSLSDLRSILKAANPKTKPKVKNNPRFIQIHKLKLQIKKLKQQIKHLGHHKNNTKKFRKIKQTLIKDHKLLNKLN